MKAMSIITSLRVQLLIMLQSNSVCLKKIFKFSDHCLLKLPGNFNQLKKSCVGAYVSHKCQWQTMFTSTNYTMFLTLYRDWNSTSGVNYTTYIPGGPKKFNKIFGYHSDCLAVIILLLFNLPDALWLWHRRKKFVIVA